MTGLTDLQRATLEAVSTHPAEYPITGKDIAAQIGLKPRSSGKEGADMRSIIHALRIKGYPICAYGKGYFYASNGDELKAYIDSLEARAREVLEAASGLKAGFAVVGQAKAQKAVQAATERRFRANSVVYKVRGDLVEAFLRQNPAAEEV